MNKIVIGIIILLVVLGGGYFAYKSMKGTPAPAPAEQQMAPTTEASPMISASASAAQEITVEASEFAFTPQTISVKAGQPVKLTFKNTGKYPHNFTVSELNIQTQTIQPGTEDVITFTPSKTGSFTYICTVPGHADRGMKGTLTVQ